MPDKRRMNLEDEDEEKRTMIAVSVRNKKRLSLIGNMTSTYDDVIDKLLSFYENVPRQ